MGGLPDPDWYLDNVLIRAEPGTARLRTPGAAEAWHDWWDRQQGPTKAATEALRRQGFVLSPAQLVPNGVTRQRARTAVAKGRWSRPAHGVVCPVDVRDADQRLERNRHHALAAAAATLRQPGHVVSGRSAAILHGLPVFALPGHPEVTDPAANGLGHNGNSHAYGARLSAGEVTDWFGVPVTDVPRTLVDLARHDRRDALMAADAALHEKLVTVVQIEDALAQAAGWPGVRQARKVLALADSRAESPLESLTRLVLHDDGFPPPDLQVEIGPYRVDMLFRRQRVVAEIDGLQKYTDAESRREKRRERRLRRLGYHVERLTWDEVVHLWPETRLWLRAALGLSG